MTDVPEPLKMTLLSEETWQELANNLLGLLQIGYLILVVIVHYSLYYKHDDLKSTTT